MLAEELFFRGFGLSAEFSLAFRGGANTTESAFRFSESFHLFFSECRPHCAILSTIEPGYRYDLEAAQENGFDSIFREDNEGVFCKCLSFFIDYRVDKIMRADVGHC